MSVALLDGPLGIEARHRWMDQTTGTIIATLGDLGPDPHYRLRDIAGLFDLEIEDVSAPRTEAAGDIAYPTRPRAKNVTYTVDVRASTLQLLRRGSAALRLAFGPDIVTGIPAMRTMRITPHPSYGTGEHAYSARCLTISPGSDAQDLGPDAMPTPWVRQYVLGLRMYDPRMYEWDSGAPFGLTNPKW